MKLARDIMSLSTFKRDSNKVMRQMKKTKEPVVLTINGKAATQRGQLCRCRHCRSIAVCTQKAY